MRAVGLDYGDKTIGVAMSDPLGIMAYGLETIRRHDEAALRKSVRRIKELVREYKADTIVLGYPLNMNGSEGERCRKTLVFRDKLSRTVKNIPIELWDERLSTVASVRGLREGGYSWDKINLIVDEAAAIYILQGYLDYKKDKE